jgi:hypothetical protein
VNPPASEKTTLASRHLDYVGRVEIAGGVMRSKREILAVTLLTGIVIALAMALSHAHAEVTPSPAACPVALRC